MKKHLLYLFIYCICPCCIWAQTIPTDGIVTDRQTGEPLIGVSVIETGTSNGTVTDLDGAFHMSVAPGATIQFSYIGYSNMELPASTNMRVQMGENTEVLEELVVTGYTAQRKADLTGSVSVMDMSKPTSEGNANMISSLQGRLAGVQITTDAAPGSGGSAIRIRGMGTMNSCEPLYIVDGVPTTENLNSINPADIASVQVLKDAASASIYGSRAANGVIIITTKQAKKDRLSVNLGYSATAQTIASSFRMLNAEQWGNIFGLANVNAGLTPSHPFYDFDAQGHATLHTFIDNSGTLRAADTDWQKEVYRTAWTHNLNASVSSSSEKANVYFSGNYMNQDGLMRESYYHRYNVRLNSDFKIGKWVKAGENLMVSQWSNNGYGTNSDGGIPFMSMRQHPAIPVYDNQGNFTSPLLLCASDIPNPVQQIFNGKDNTNDSWRIFGNAYLEVNPWVKGLYLKTNIGYEHVQYHNISYGRRTNASDLISMGDAYGEGDTWTWTNTAMYTNTFAQAHHLTALIGTEAIGYTFREVSAGRTGYAFDDTHYMVINSGDKSSMTNGGSKTTWALFSVFGKVDYNYGDRYLASLTVRRDATSRLSKKNRTGWFPAASLAWRFTAESFWPENPWMTDGKVRVSWGQNGNSAISNNYAAYSTYVYAGNAYYNLNATDSTTVAGIALNSTGNENLKWETTTQTNVGLDLGFFNNSLIINADWYLKKTTDMITTPPVLSTAGEGAAYVANTGDMENMGVEINVDYHSPDYNGFSWAASLNVAHYKNKVVKLNDYTNSLGGDVRLMVGQPMGVYYGYVADGIFSSREEVMNHAIQKGKDLGRIRYRDLDGDGQITTADQCIIGDPNPNLSAGLNLDLSYKGLTLSMFFTGEFGFDIINSTKRQLYLMSYGAASTNRSADLLSAWSIDNPTSTIPAVTVVDNNNETRMSTYYVEDGSYVKMKYLKLSYDFPKRWLTPWHCQGINLYGQIENIFTITRYSGLDPELPLSGYGSRIDNAPYPRSRNFSLGVSLAF